MRRGSVTGGPTKNLHDLCGTEFRKREVRKETVLTRLLELKKGSGSSGEGENEN